MNSTALTTKPAPAPPRRRRWLRGMLIIFLPLIAIPLGVYVYTVLSTRGAWAAAEEKASQDLPRWQLMELEADRKAIADEQNSALHLIAVFRAGKGVSVSGFPKYEEMFDKLPPTVELNSQQLAVIRGELGKIAGSLEEARKLKDMPYGRFPLTFTADYIGTLLTDQQNSRQVGDWLKHDAFERAHAGDHEGAIDSCRAGLNAGRALADEPFVISLLVRLAHQEMAMQALERVLAQTTEPSGPALKEMQALLELEAKECNLVAAIRGERAGYHHLFTNIKAGTVTTNWLRGLGIRAGGGGFGNPAALWIVDVFPGTLLKYHPDFLEQLNNAVDVAKLPRHERLAKANDFDVQMRASSNPVVRTLMPAFSRANQFEARGQARLTAAAAALACERYRLKHGGWPATLDALVKDAYLAEMPVDPFDNQPLRYLRNKEGIVIYSVGLDKKDGGGVIDPERWQEPGVDVGFRLWNVGNRRQAPRPILIFDDGNAVK